LLVDRIRRSFADEVLVLEGANLGDSIVFAFKDPKVPVKRMDPLRTPRHLDGARPCNWRQASRCP
jgi:hypothetical protein